MEDRYFVDERVGCIAVRDRQETDPEYNGLHSDTTGVIKYWHGERVEGKVCSKCGHRGSDEWVVTEGQKDEALALCDSLNLAASFTADWSQKIHEDVAKQVRKDGTHIGDGSHSDGCYWSCWQLGDKFFIGLNDSLDMWKVEEVVARLYAEP